MLIRMSRGPMLSGLATAASADPSERSRPVQVSASRVSPRMSQSGRLMHPILKGTDLPLRRGRRIHGTSTMDVHRAHLRGWVTNRWSLPGREVGCPERLRASGSTPDNDGWLRASIPAISLRTTDFSAQGSEYLLFGEVLLNQGGLT